MTTTNSQPMPLYNLMMSGNDDAWKGSTWRMGYDRVFEHTVEAIKHRFQPQGNAALMDDAALTALMRLPTLFTYEKSNGGPAFVGRITALHRGQSEFVITLERDPTVAPLSHETYVAMMADLDISGRVEPNRTHWAVKNVDLGIVLHRAGVMAHPVLSPPPRPPKVFVSYSWDSDAHRAWVVQLATWLRQHGVDAVLDRWHVRPGEELPAFMVRSLREADRVLVICTERYAQKSRNREGGVGFEQMLSSAILLRDVGTNKFLPVVRQAKRPYDVPDELQGHLFIDLSDGPGEQAAYLELLRDLHDTTAIPPVGPRPAYFGG